MPRGKPTSRAARLLLWIALRAQTQRTNQEARMILAQINDVVAQLADDMDANVLVAAAVLDCFLHDDDEDRERPID
jgi:hypothetical protein